LPPEGVQVGTRPGKLCQVPELLVVVDQIKFFEDRFGLAPESSAENPSESITRTLLHPFRLHFSNEWRP
jgi:hypothetical protein